MDCDNSLNKAANKFKSDAQKFIKYLIELQSLRKENRMLKMELSNTQLKINNLTHEVNKLSQINSDLKNRNNMAYSVINAFNKHQAEIKTNASHKTVKLEALEAENNLLTEQNSTLQGNISKLTIEHLDLSVKCRQLEMNSLSLNDKYTSACDLLQTLKATIRKMEHNQASLKKLIEKTNCYIHDANETINLNNIRKVQMQEINSKMSRKITELLMKISIQAQDDNTPIVEPEILTNYLAYEKSLNVELSNNLSLSICNQFKFSKAIGKLCDTAVQTDNCFKDVFEF